MTKISIRQRLANFIVPAMNKISLPSAFLKYGNRNRMFPNFDTVMLDKYDLYSGYSYAAIHRRASAVSRTAKDFLVTKSNVKPSVMNGEEVSFEHPYFQVLRESPSFTDFEFWYNISTYLDIKGVFYLMAVRRVVSPLVSDIKYFKLLNPFYVQRIVKQPKDGDTDLQIGGYIESINGLQREIPKEMIIEIKELNPFNQLDDFSLMEAAKEPQFSLKTAADYTRKAMRNNINAPGILTTDVVLPEQQFDNFIERVRNHEKGEPIYGNGAGAVKYEGMNMELSKAALKDINEINRDLLLSVSGESKTTMNIEQSGVTRDTAKVQKDMKMEDHIIPRIQRIIDAINQDYRNYYPDKYAQTEAQIVISNPLGSDHDAELKATEVRTKQLELYTVLVNKGYAEAVASDYVEGKIDLEGLGKPTNPPVTIPENKEENPDENPEADNRVENQNNPNDAELLSSSHLIHQQEASLQNGIIQIQKDLLTCALNRLPRKMKNAAKNATVDDGLISEAEKKRNYAELVAVLSAYFWVIYQIQGSQVMKRRMARFGLSGVFIFGMDSKKTIEKIVKKVAEGHINTVSVDILDSARRAALEGKSLQEVQSYLKNVFNDKITKERAKTIARTETNRAFTMVQYEADSQFIMQNGLEKRAYKKWVTRSDHPCEFCKALEAEGEIPFFNDFRSLGSSIKTKGGILDVDFTDLQSGNAHTNCQCVYELIIRDDESAKKITEERKKNEEIKIALDEENAEIEKRINEIEKTLNDL